MRRNLRALVLGVLTMFDLILRGGKAVLPWGIEALDLGVRDGRIAAMGDLRTAEAAEVVDCRHLHVLPGLIDAHVHLREPGDPSVETIATGTRAAVLGGLVAVFDMPNTTPSITDTAQLAWKRGHVSAQAYCDMGLYVGAARSNVAELAALEIEDNVCAVKVFAGSSTGDLLIEDDATLEAVMRSGRRRIAYHSEDEYRLQERKPRYHSGMPHRMHAEWGEVTDAAMRVCGGAAFSKHLGIERAFRDARAGGVMAPTADVLYDFYGRALCGLELF